MNRFNALCPAVRGRRLLLLLVALVLALTSPHSMRAQDPDPPTVDLRDRLASTPLTLDFDQISLMDVLAMAFDRARVQFILDPDLSEDLADAIIDIGIHVKDVPANTVIDILLELMDCDCSQAGGLMMVHPEGDGPTGSLIPAVYDISDLLEQHPDQPCGLVGPRPVGPYEWGEFDRPDVLDADWIQELVDVRLQDLNSNADYRVDTVGTALTVTATMAGHREVEHLLASLRAGCVSVRVVATEWQVCASAWREVLGADGSVATLDAAALDRHCPATARDGSTRGG